MLSAILVQSTLNVMVIIIVPLVAVHLVWKEIHLNDAHELNVIQILIVLVTELALTIIASIRVHLISIHHAPKMQSAMCAIILLVANVQMICLKGTHCPTVRRNESNKINRNVSKIMTVPVKWLAFAINV